VAPENPQTATGATRHDGWRAADSYESYMGRWSRKVAPRFLDWLEAPFGCDWLEVGCGTGALSGTVLAQCDPRSLVAIDSSEAFIDMARARVPDPRAAFQIGDAQMLPVEDGSRDVIVSALVINFVPDRAKALAEARRVARGGGVIGFYVWDYPGGGMQFMHAFWTAAVALNPAAAELSEHRGFPFCTPDI
jgi:ubiquinone/menaquinone biosynthesis C-methylase UbiE